MLQKLYEHKTVGLLRFASIVAMYLLRNMKRMGVDLRAGSSGEKHKKGKWQGLGNRSNTELSCKTNILNETRY